MIVVNTSRRSLLNFMVLIVFGLGTTIFILNQAAKAVAEIRELSNAPIYLGTDKIKDK